MSTCEAFSAFRSFSELLELHKSSLVGNAEFLANAFDTSTAASFPTREAALDLLIGEAEETLRMIEPYLRPGARLLEVGGGVGLVYAMLKARGVDVVSLEPGGQGFGSRHLAGLRLLSTLNIDSSGWLEMGIEDFPTPSRPFDLIFSYFVLEHIADLERAFQVMSRGLASGGLMVHCCPNYSVPFDPHFNVPLFPFKPEWTALFYPGLRKSGLWKGLRFTTVAEIARLCNRHGLQPSFCRGMTVRMLERVLSDPVFAARKQGLVKPARLLQSAGWLKFLRCLPPHLNTPMRFTAYKTKAAATNA